MAQIIPLHRNGRPVVPAARTVPIVPARTLRPPEIALLLPVALPLVPMIVVLLLAWFVVWLTIVALLTGAIVSADLAHRTMRRLPASPLDREVVSFQGR